MNARQAPTSFLCTALVTALCSLVAGSVRAERSPQDPIILWGIERACAVDPGLSGAVAERLGTLGVPLLPVADQG